MIEELLNLSIKQLRGINLKKENNLSSKPWNPQIEYKRKGKSLGYYHDPYTACLIYCFVKTEISGRHPIKDRYLAFNEGYWIIKKVINRVPTYFGRFKKIEHARAERDLLEKCNWDYEAWFYSGTDDMVGVII